MYPWIEAYATTKKGAIKTFKIEWDAVLFLLQDKMFGMLGHNQNKEPILSLKIEPSYASFLVENYPDIAPGYYLNKKHWVSIRLEGDIEHTLIKELIDQSYQNIYQSLPKKTQRMIDAT